MKCISDGMVQKYIDGETSEKENLLIKYHLADCKECQTKIDGQKALSFKVKSMISLLHEDTKEIPQINLKTNQNINRYSRLKKLLYAAAAASIVGFSVFLVQKYNQNPEPELIYVYEFENGYDANLTVAQQELVIHVIDPEGNVSEVSLE